MPTPFPCIPATRPAANSPARKGSSERYSKFRPHSGERFMFTPGPRMTSTFKAIHSSAMASPILRSRSISQVEARQEAVGKQVAGRLDNISDLPSGTLRTPCGPSDMVIAGRPSRSICTVVHVLAPVQIAAFSSRVICLITVCACDMALLSFEICEFRRRLPVDSM